MKTLITFIAAIGFSSVVSGQYNSGFHHADPMSVNDYNRSFQYVKNEAFDEDKMRVAKRIADTNYMTSNQIMRLVRLFSFANNQEAFARYAYPRTYNKKNYFEVYEGFSFLSSKRKVSDWVNQQSVNDYSYHHKDQGYHENQGHHNQQGHHDNHNHYHAPIYCGPAAMSDNDYNRSFQYVKNEAFDVDKMRVAKRIADTNFMTSNQVMRLIRLFSFAKNQEAFARYAYSRTYDQKNYFEVYQAFSFLSGKRKVSQWVSQQPINDYRFMYR
jgi:hypothetical protein